jgi:predicted GIY-YIG superfamily endonuclease
LIWLGFISCEDPTAGITSAPLNLDARFRQHLRGHTATTKRLGDTLEIVAKKEVRTLGEAREIERLLKRKKNLKLAIYHLQR